MAAVRPRRRRHFRSAPAAHEAARLPAVRLRPPRPGRAALPRVRLRVRLGRAARPSRRCTRTSSSTTRTQRPLVPPHASRRAAARAVLARAVPGQPSRPRRLWAYFLIVWRWSLSPGARPLHAGAWLAPASATAGRGVRGSRSGSPAGAAMQRSPQRAGIPRSRLDRAHRRVPHRGGARLPPTRSCTSVLSRGGSCRCGLHVRGADGLSASDAPRPVRPVHAAPLRDLQHRHRCSGSPCVHRVLRRGRCSAIRRRRLAGDRNRARRGGVR